MNRTQKAEQIAQIKELVSNSNAVYFIDYAGVNVEDISKLRREFRKENITYKVFKNTLIVKALEELGWTNLEELKPLLKGMTGVAFTGENIAAAAKIIKEYYSKNDKFSLKACAIEGKIYDKKSLDMLTSIPGRKELMASVVGSINAPAQGIYGAINAVIRELAVVIGEIEKKKAA
ncbi:MAG TPA: 50S ribosomal protein L10 [Ignavibacteriales bacterium]|jgi:large subunit ribosomal protein L10|nr:50S ribosomal protein L10 [Ignavibacteriales bacterium]